MTFESIINHGEFFSDHYLESMVAADLKDLRKRWLLQEKHGDSARTRFRRLTRRYSDVRNAAGKALAAKSTARSRRAVQTMNQMVLEALGFAVRPADVELTRTGEHTVTIPVAHDTSAPHDTIPVHSTTPAHDTAAPHGTMSAHDTASADDTGSAHDTATAHHHTTAGDSKGSFKDESSAVDRSSVAGDRLLVLEAGFTTDTDQFRATEEITGGGVGCKV